MENAGRKSATKFLCVKTVSKKVVRYSSAISPCENHWRGTSLSTWKFGGYWLWYWGDPFYLKFWVNRPPLERNRRFSTDIWS